ncbi:MAG: HAMP domain-containing sensor histidine kinase [Candidatus Paceibacterota bacterium]|jgi:signal transduction histidine kinase
MIERFADLGGIGLICSDSIPTVFGLLDPSIAPPFLYYSYIPIIVIALLFGLFVLIVSRETLSGRLLLWIAIVFSLLLASELFLWIAVSAPMVHFVWQTIILFHAVLSFLLIYFTHTFLTGGPMQVRWQWLILLFLLPIFVLAPTTLNLSAFDLANCESVQGPLWLYMYALEIGALVISFLLCMRKGKQRKNQEEYKKALTLGIGIIIFFGIFILSNMLGDITLIYNINLFGPLGMVAFIAFIAYLIVKYHAFHMRVLGAQALVGALIALIFAALFVRTIEHVRYILIGTLVFVIILGILLIRSVKREVEQRERIEKLAGELQTTNERQNTLLHFIGHEVKGFLTKDAGVFASLSESDFGALSEAQKTFIDRALVETRHGVDSVENILKASNLKKGTVTYTKAPFDLKALAAEAVEKARPAAKLKGLELTFTADESSYQMTGDRAQINDHVLRNIIDNSINYTPAGSVAVALKKDAGKLIFSVKDTGIGITDEDKKRLFTEGGHGKDSQRVNVHSTGYGLYIAKQIAEANEGTIRAESGGEGKGSTFIVEFSV